MTTDVMKAAQAAWRAIPTWRRVMALQESMNDLWNKYDHVQTGFDVLLDRINRAQTATDASTIDQRFVAQAFEIERLRQRADQQDAIIKAQSEQLRALNVLAMNMSTVLRQYEGDGR